MLAENDLWIPRSRSQKTWRVLYREATSRRKCFPGLEDGGGRGLEETRSMSPTPGESAGREHVYPATLPGTLEESHDGLDPALGHIIAETALS